MLTSFRLSSEQLNAFLLSTLNPTTAPVFAKILAINYDLFEKFIELLYFERITFQDILNIDTWTNENILSFLLENEYRYEVPVLENTLIRQDIPSLLLLTYGINDLMNDFHLVQKYYKHNKLSDILISVKLGNPALYTSTTSKLFVNELSLQNYVANTILPMIYSDLGITTLSELNVTFRSSSIAEVATYFSGFYEKIYQYIANTFVFDPKVFYKYFIEIDGGELPYIYMYSKLSRAIVDLHVPTENFNKYFQKLCYDQYAKPTTVVSETYTKVTYDDLGNAINTEATRDVIYYNETIDLVLPNLADIHDPLEYIMETYTNIVLYNNYLNTLSTIDTHTKNVAHEYLLGIQDIIAVMTKLQNNILDIFYILKKNL